MTCEEILRMVEAIEAELGDGSTDHYPAPDTITEGQLRKLSRTVQQLVAQLEEAEAQCAAMRSYIDKLEDTLVWCTAADDFAPNGKAREGFEKIVPPLLDQIGKFDSQDAGRKFMSRFHKLEAVAEAAREYLHDIDAPALNQPTAYQYESGEDKSWRLRKALAALEGENNVDY